MLLNFLLGNLKTITFYLTLTYFPPCGGLSDYFFLPRLQRLKDPFLIKVSV